MSPVYFEILHGNEKFGVLNQRQDLTRFLEFYLLKCNSSLDETGGHCPGRKFCLSSIYKYNKKTCVF
jgi:hypothetical protein